MYMTDEKYQPLAFEVEERPIIVVGQNPGKTRKGKYSPYVWDGDTPTSNLLRNVVKPYTNLVLTNICNYQVMTKEHVTEGIEDLRKMIDELEPKKIICLGSYAHLAVASLSLDVPIVKVMHPSYIIRFNKNREEYVKKIRKELT